MQFKGRGGYEYADLADIMQVAHQGANFGLCHYGAARMVGEGLYIWTECLKHVSGEQVHCDFPIKIPDGSWSKETPKELGGLITYARKYCIQSVYGLYGDDGHDPDADQRAASHSAPAPRHTSAPKPTPTAAPQPITVAEAQAADGDPEDLLTVDQHAAAIAYLKGEDGARMKKELLKKFFPKKEKLFATDLKQLKHLHFLDQLAAPF